MRKIFTKYLCLYMALALAVTAMCVFGMQTYMNQRDNTKSSYEKLKVVEEKLADNNEEIEQLKGSLNDNSLAKTRAFAYMLQQDETLKDNKVKMQKVCDLLGVDELHVVDEKGIITHSTVPAYVGFDMNGGEQTLDFIKIIDDPTLEIAQEPQPNAAAGILFQYVGVARKDAKGLVQVGIRPTVLEEMLASNEIDVVLSGYDVGTNGYVFAIDQIDNTILAHQNADLVGTDATQAGFPKDMAAGTGKVTVDGTKCYYVAEEYDGMLLGTMLPASEYYAVRKNQTLVVSFSIFILFIILILMINRLLNHKIANGILQIAEDLEGITQGDLDRKVTQDDNPEFVMLSNSINQMVESIKNNMSENTKLLEQQKIEMERNQELISQVKAVSNNIDVVSKETLQQAKVVHEGTDEQKNEVEYLHETMEQLVQQLKDSAITSDSISKSTKESVDKMLRARNNMEDLMSSIKEISNMSQMIVQIIDEINSIAAQTNMLSLNASIEAARAGEQGKGFAVVATQVGELAARSAKAAQETTQLIHNTVDVVSQGERIADTVVEEFLGVVSEMEQESKEIVKVAQMAEQQVGVVGSAVKGLNRIAEVVENNVEVSKDSEKTSENLATEADKLYQIVG